MLYVRSSSSLNPIGLGIKQSTSQTGCRMLLASLSTGSNLYVFVKHQPPDINRITVYLLWSLFLVCESNREPRKSKNKVNKSAHGQCRAAKHDSVAVDLWSFVLLLKKEQLQWKHDTTSVAWVLRAEMEKNLIKSLVCSKMVEGLLVKTSTSLTSGRP